ncbi:MAG: hypothetical protein ACM3OC_07575 [Deltaproteobacteria bacterium]
MGRRKCADHDKCRRIAAVQFSGDNFICSGESRDSTYACDNVRLCIRSVISNRRQEMTIEEAQTIRDCLSRTIEELSRRKK